MKRKRFVLLWLLALIMVLTAACGKDASPAQGSKDEPVPGGTAAVPEESQTEPESTMPAEQEVPGDSSGESAGDVPAEESGDPAEESAQQSEEAEALYDSYVFITGTGLVIEMSAEAAPILEQLGEYDNCFEAVGCAGLGTQRYYIYSGFELGTYEDEDGDGTERIYSVVFSNDLTMTTEGVCIGDTLEWAMSVYPDCNGTEAVMATEKGNCRISFSLADGIITGIQYITLAV